MILTPLRRIARRLWPVMRLRSLLLLTLLFVAALPGVSAVILRVYENALVRRTEGELLAQSAALAASAALLWPANAAGTLPTPAPPAAADRYSSASTTPAASAYHDSAIDLSASPILPERPAAIATRQVADPQARAIATALAPAISETKAATLSSILLLDHHGIVLNGPDAGKSLAQLPEIQRALAGQRTTLMRANAAYQLQRPLVWISRATGIRLHHARPILSHGKIVGVILVSRSPNALFRGMWEDRGKIALGVTVIFGLLLLLTAILARAIIAPLEDLSRASHALAAGRTAEPRRPTLQIAEIRDLYQDFATMADAIDRRSAYLRDFAAALSHEFKTPLAAMRGSIELLQDHGETMRPEEQQRFLANMASDGDRLSRLVSRLMELAKADLPANNVGDASDVAALLRHIQAQYSDALCRVAITIAGALPPVALADAPLETILHCLIENAAQAGASHITIAAAREDTHVILTLHDNGPGIPAADHARIFEPFFTSKRSSGGTGLGLSIARALALNARGDLILLPGADGATFQLRLPLVTRMSHDSTA